MNALTASDQVWNHACNGGGKSSREGDKALAALLAFHSVAMNGGVLHAIERLPPAKRAAVKAGYSFYGFTSVVEFLTGVQEELKTH